jgi:membrane protease subunit HflC
MLFVVRQYEDVIVTRFGKAVRIVTEPGLKLKLPLFDKVNRFDKRVLAWEGPPTECPTKDKLYLIVDCFARWRISDPLLYYNRLATNAARCRGSMIFSEAKPGPR